MANHNPNIEQTVIKLYRTYLKLEVLASVVTFHNILIETTCRLYTGCYSVGVVGVTL